jgi:hypothetical protein
MASGVGAPLAREQGAGVGDRSGQPGSDLIGRVREQVSARASRNRFVDLLEAGGVPRERLTWLAGEQFRIVGAKATVQKLDSAASPVGS